MKIATRPLPRVVLRRALASLSPALEMAFARGEIHTESDLNYVVVGHLKEALRRSPGLPTWVIGTNHPLDEVRPDVCCYFVNCPYQEFMTDKERWLVGVVEIKFASSLKYDLEKLSRYQKKRRDLIAWMVYGDHFSVDIHARYCREGLLRMKRIDEWVRSRPSRRGKSILRCGDLHKNRRLRAYRDLIVAFNANYWIRDNE